MAGDDPDEDAYVANLLKEDAKAAAKKYEFVGLGAFSAQRSANRAPRPNTSFLRNIIRQTDSHNAALLAKEAEESRARLKEMRTERGPDKKGASRGSGRLTPPPMSDDDERRPPKRKRSHYYESDTETDRERGTKQRHHRESRQHRSRKDAERDRITDRKKSRRRHGNSEDEGHERLSRHSRRDTDRERRHRREREEELRHGRRREGSRHRQKGKRSESRASPKSRSRSPRPHRRRKSSRQRNDPHSGSRSRSRSRTRTTTTHDSRKNHEKNLDERASHKRVPRAPDSDSDPLEAIVGPLPPPPQPAVRYRGRGAHKASSMGLDAKFSSAYDPTIDVRADSDMDDDWGDAVERFRDQQKWKQSGADRLRQAGFTDDQVKKWEKGDEKTEADVVWAARGSTKEWDRGKVVDDDGDVTLKADFGRLK